MSDQVAPNINLHVMQQLGEVQGQLASITLLIQNNQAQTNQRINDLSTSVTERLNGIDSRLQRVESNERNTAVKAGTAGAASSALVTAGIELLKRALG